MANLTSSVVHRPSSRMAQLLRTSANPDIILFDISFSRFESAVGAGTIRAYLLHGMMVL
jgi:hypothetical protein